MKGNPGLTPAERQLLSLVRASLWQKPADTEAFAENGIDWKSIEILSLKQTVGILAIEGAMTLPENLLPPKEWVRHSFSFIERNRRTHILLDRCIAEAVARLREKGIRTVLLKGEAYARAYPSPELRQCGDIDIYIGEENYHAAYKAAKGFCQEYDEYFMPEGKHYGCSLHGVRIELHRIAGKLPQPDADHEFQLWSRAQLDNSGFCLEIGGECVNVPPPLFDIVFVFFHLYHHFINGGIGLRHLCDWTMLLHAHSKEIDSKELEKLLIRFNLMRGWKTFAPVAVVHLGLPESECPFYSEKYILHSNRILDIVMKEGNFGRGVEMASPRPKRYFKSKLFSLGVITTRSMKLLRVDHRTVTGNYLSYLYNGIAAVINDMMKGGKR